MRGLRAKDADFFARFCGQAGVIRVPAMIAGLAGAAGIAAQMAELLAFCGLWKNNSHGVCDWR